MTNRVRLPNRRHSAVFNFEHKGLAFTASFSRYTDDGRVGEVFVQNHKNGSGADAFVRDAAVACSLALQSGVPLDVLRRALLRDSHGRPQSPIAAALDLIAEDER
jgi:ribonucleoside-diphosphate reductase alpha chain